MSDKKWHFVLKVRNQLKIPLWKKYILLLKLQQQYLLDSVTQWKNLAKLLASQKLQMEAYIGKSGT